MSRFSEVAAAQIMALFDGAGRDPVEHVRCNVELVVRSTTGPAPRT